MIHAIRQRVTVQPGGRIELCSPDLHPGSQADVIVLPDATAPSEPAAQAVPQPLASFIGSGKGCFGTTDEVDAFIRSERDQWER